MSNFARNRYLKDMAEVSLVNLASKTAEILSCKQNNCAVVIPGQLLYNYGPLGRHDQDLNLHIITVIIPLR